MTDSVIAAGMCADPLGLTPEQRAWSNASEQVARETPSWWSPEFRDAVTAMLCADVRMCAGAN